MGPSTFMLYILCMIDWLIDWPPHIPNIVCVALSISAPVSAPYQLDQFIWSHHHNPHSLSFPPTKHISCYYALIHHHPITYPANTQSTSFSLLTVAWLIQGSFSSVWKLVEHGINWRIRRVFRAIWASYFIHVCLFCWCWVDLQRGCWNSQILPSVPVYT